jgi:hypothetical protein
MDIFVYFYGWFGFLDKLRAGRFAEENGVK